MLAALPLHAHAHVVHTKSNTLADTISNLLTTSTTSTTIPTTTDKNDDKNMTKSRSSIHELQAPNFKRTDSTDKVRLRVEEMATHRENGTLPTSGASRFGADGSNNYMKGMQYTFAVDPRVKPIATTASSSATGATGAPGAEGGKSMMGKMRVRPMHPPPVPPNRVKGAEVGKDGDTTMHPSGMATANGVPAGSNAARNNEHAMDVSEDHSHDHHGDTKMHEDSATIASAADSAEHGEHANEQQHDSDTYFDSEEGAGHHTPTPQHLLPSHHPSALPYPPTTANPQVLSNALSSSTGQFGSQSNYANSGSSNARPAQPHIVRFPTIFSSDFGPTSLLCAIPTSSNPNTGPAFSFESPQDMGNGYQSFSALGPNTERSITTQGIYGPSGPPGGMGYSTTASTAHGTRVVNNSNTFSAAGMNGIGVGMQHANTPFDFGVPRPTFEFPIEEILKSDMGEDELGGGPLGENAAGASEITPWDANNVNININLAAGVDGMFGLGGMGATSHWGGVPPSEIHNPNGANNLSSSIASGNSTTPTSPTKRHFHGSVGATPVLSRQNSTPATVAYGTLVAPTNTAGGNVVGGNKDGVSAGQMQTGQVNTKVNNTSPASVHSNASTPITSIKGESAYDGTLALWQQ
jgi:hypothetical protein